MNLSNSGHKNYSFECMNSISNKTFFQLFLKMQFNINDIKIKVVEYKPNIHSTSLLFCVSYYGSISHVNLWYHMLPINLIALRIWRKTGIEGISIIYPYFRF